MRVLLAGMPQMLEEILVEALKELGTDVVTLRTLEGFDTTAVKVCANVVVVRLAGELIPEKCTAFVIANPDIKLLGMARSGRTLTEVFVRTTAIAELKLKEVAAVIRNAVELAAA